VLVGNKIDMPGRRMILQEDAENFAYSHGMEYFETSQTDDLEVINEIFQSIISQICKKISFIERAKLKSERYESPIGLQLNLALEPTWKFKYKQKLKNVLPSEVATSTVDWFGS
jgi:GTPase SAR1 family protein